MGSRKRNGQPGPLHRLWHWVEYLSLRGLAAMLMAMPPAKGRKLASLVGDLIRVLDSGGRRQRAVQNLQSAFPGMSAQRARQVIRQVYRNLPVSVLEALVFLRLAASDRHMECVETRGFDRLAAVDPEHGVIFVTGHFGCWEILGPVAASMGYPTCAVVRPLSNPHLNAYVRKMRGIGLELVLRKRGDMREVLRLLRKGKNVGFLVDQDARRDGIFVPFFGRPASTVSSVARLSIRTGAPVALVCARRQSRRLSFRVEVRDLIRPQPNPGNEEEEIYRITRRFTAGLEKLIREAPQQWLWLHKRWKTYPGKYD